MATRGDRVVPSPPGMRAHWFSKLVVILGGLTSCRSPTVVPPASPARAQAAEAVVEVADVGELRPVLQTSVCEPGFPFGSGMFLAPDGRLFAARCSSYLRVWDLGRDGLYLGDVGLPALASFALTADLETIAVLDDRRGVVERRSISGRRLGETPVGQSVYAFTVRGDGRELAFVAAEGARFQLKIVDLSGVLQAQADLPGIGAARMLRWSAGGEAIAVSDDRGQLWVYAVSTRAVTRPAVLVDTDRWSIRADGKEIAAIDPTTPTRILVTEVADSGWSSPRGLPLHAEGLALQFLTSGELAAIDRSANAYRWDASRSGSGGARPISGLGPHEMVGSGVIAASTGALALRSGDMIVRRIIAQAPGEEQLRPLPGFDPSPVVGSSFHPTQRALCLTHGNGLVSLWEFGREPRALWAGTSVLQREPAIWSRSGELLFIASESPKEFVAWDPLVGEGRIRRPIPGTMSLHRLPDERLLGVAGRELLVLRPDGSIVRRVDAGGVIESASVDPTDGTVYFTRDRRLSAWDGAGDGAGVRALAEDIARPLAAWGGALVESGGSLVRVTRDGSREDLKALSPGPTISALTISADGAWIGLGYGDGQVALSSLKDGRNLWINAGPPAWITTLSISADGGLLVSGDDEGIIQLWDAATGGLQATLLVQPPAPEAEGDPQGALQWLVLSSDGRIDGTSIARTMVRWRSGEDVVTTDRPWRERRDRGILDRILGPGAPPGK